MSQSRPERDQAAMLPWLTTDDLWPREIADALWLGWRLGGDPPGQRAAEPGPPDGREMPRIPEMREAGAVTPPAGDAGSDFGDSGIGAEPVAAPSPRVEEAALPDRMSPDPGIPAHRWSDPPSLPGRRSLGRALLPFARTEPSRRRRELDVDATATHAAESGVWAPQWRPGDTHPLEAVVLADEGASMAIWRRTVAGFRRLLEERGAFSNVRMMWLDSDAVPEGAVLVRGESAVSPARSPAELVDPTGHRIVFVLTDGVGMAWRTRALRGWLCRLGGAGPVVLINVLPQTLWSWGNLLPERTWLFASGPRLANRRLQHRPSQPRRRGSRTGQERALLPLPVLELQPRWLSRWSTLVSSAGPVAVVLPALLLDPAEPDEEPPQPPDDSGIVYQATAAERVCRFRAVASPAAFRLAGLLAAAPLNISVMRLVQRSMMPGSRTSDLAEVFLSGLLRRVGDRPIGGNPYTIEFDFVDGVRSELLATRVRLETAQVLRLVSDHLGAHVAAMRNLRAALVEPTVDEDVDISVESLPFVQVEQLAMAALSGPYAVRANRLRRAIRRFDDTRSGEFMTEFPTSNGGEVDTPPGVLSADVPMTSTLSGVDDLVASRGDDLTADVTATSPKLRQSTELPAVWGGVPARNVNFTGRDALLKAVRERLSAGSMTAVLPEALHGLGGVGKTLLAVEYVYWRATDYDLVWWIPAEDPAQIQASFGALARRLGLAAEGVGAHVAVGTVLEALRTGRPAERWLLVFDNADRPRDVRPFVPAGPGHILITSRNSQWSSVAHPVEVDVFTRQESRALLQRRCPGMADADADRLAEVLGDLPLAVEQAGSWCAETGMPAAEYLRLFSEKRLELLRDKPPVDYPVAVAAAWNVSLERLREHHPSALQLARVCSFLSSEPIATTIFQWLRDATVPAELSEALGDPVKLRKAIREISRYGLAKIDHRHDVVQFHRLVQAAVRDQMAPGEHDQMAHIAHLLLLNAMPARPADVKSWPVCEHLLPHVRASRAVDCHESMIRMIVVYLAVYLISWGDPQAAVDLMVEARGKWADRFGEDHSDMLAAGRQLGIAYRTLGRYREAREIHEQTYELLRSTVGDNHEETLAMGNLLAQDLRAVGDFSAALEINVETYRRALRVLGQTEPLTLSSAGYLAASLRLMGDYVQARLLDDGSAARLVEAYGADDRFAMAARDRLALDLRELGQYLVARDMQEDTVLRYRKLFGDDHANTLSAMKNLAVARRKAGDHEGALELARQTYEGLRQRYGDEHPDVLAAASNLAVDLRQTGDLRAARELGTSTWQRYGKVLGGGHLYTFVAAVNLAVSLRHLGDLEEARRLNTEALEKLREMLDEDHPYTLVCAINVASDHYVAGEFESSMAQDEDTWRKSVLRLGEDHPTTLAVQLNLSLDRRSAGRSCEADELSAHVVSRLVLVLGEAHPAVRAASSGVRADCDIEPLPF